MCIRCFYQINYHTYGHIRCVGTFMASPKYLPWTAKSLESVIVCLIIFRDGSHGLLRRPTRYNTLLIRNTRIIRKRIYAILGGTLGLHQPPSNHHKLSPQPPEHNNASW